MNSDLVKKEKETKTKTNTVAQILYSGLGGHASVVFSLIDADVERRWKNNLIFYGVEDLKPEYGDKCRSLGIPFDFIKKKEGPDVKSFFTVFRSLRKHKPDCILLHSPLLIPVLMAHRLLSPCKIIMVEHNPNQLKKGSEWWWTKLGMKFAYRMVYLTQTYADEVRQALGPLYNPGKVVIIPNGINTTLYHPSLEETNLGDGLVISMVARFSRTKDQRTLLLAFAELLKEWPDADLTLVLAGDGETLNEVKELAHALNTGDSVRFPGLLGEEGIVPLLQATTVYVHSTHSETMSTSIMQAMSCGLPVLTSDVLGVNNLIDGNNGWLFPAGDVQALRHKLIALINDSGARTGLGNRARDYAEERFSNTKMFERYNALLTTNNRIKTEKP